MKHTDHVNLLRDGVLPGGYRAVAAVGEYETWADLGAGAGAFTLALADLIGDSATIYAVDRDRSALQALRQAMHDRFPLTVVHDVTGDFTRALPLPPLDGIVMANSLHFVTSHNKEAVLRRVKAHLKPGGRFILVEYNIDHGNLWVPHPLSYPTWEALSRRVGFLSTHLLATVPSHFLGQIYAAASCNDMNAD